MMAAEAATLINVPHGKKKVTNTAIVVNSLTMALPIVVPEATSHLEGKGSKRPAKSGHKSAPSSPEREGAGRRNKGFFKKHLSRPKSPTHHPNKSSHSDPESSSIPSPQTRPRWLTFKNKKKKSPDVNGDIPTSSHMTSSSGSSLEPEATPVDQLPGRTNCGSNVPEIRVSSETHEEAVGGLVSYEDISGILDPYRKNSQSSRCSSGSGLVSVGTSGVGSLLSPSGDESSDLESPLSPCSRCSSFTDDTPGQFSDFDPIDKDYPTAHKSPSVSSENLSVTTPTPTSESPPLSASEVVTSPTCSEGKELKDSKKKKEKQGPKVSPYIGFMC